MGDVERGQMPGAQQIADQVNAQVRAEGTLVQYYRCPVCHAPYTSKVNLRAHQFAKHHRGDLGAYPTKDLLRELQRRGDALMMASDKELSADGAAMSACAGAMFKNLVGGALERTGE